MYDSVTGVSVGEGLGRDTIILSYPNTRREKRMGGKGGEENKGRREGKIEGSHHTATNRGDGVRGHERT
jgi:hypothetical protein